MLATRLQLIGSVRGADDAARVDRLKAEARALGLGIVGEPTGAHPPCLEFIVGAPRPVLVAALGAATAGLHAMRDEHFGISVVEYGAAGAVPIAHASGGPASDIVVPAHPSPRATGILADSVPAYTDAIWWAVAAGAGEREAVARAARARVAQFSDAAFEHGWVDLLNTVAPGVGV